MQRWASLVIVVLLAGHCGCAPEARRGREMYIVHKDVATLTWVYFDGRTLKDPDEALFILNGEAMGKGGPGLRAVIASVGSLPAGTELYIYPDATIGHTPSELEQAYIAGGTIVRTVPFMLGPFGGEDLRLELIEAARKQGVIMWLLPGQPGEYVERKTGEQIREEFPP